MRHSPSAVQGLGAVEEVVAPRFRGGEGGGGGESVIELVAGAEGIRSVFFFSFFFCSVSFLFSQVFFPSFFFLRFFFRLHLFLTLSLFLPLPLFLSPFRAGPARR